MRPSPRDFDLLETMLWSSSGGYLLLDYHLKHLAQSADYFGIPMDLRQVQNELANVVGGLSACLFPSGGSSAARQLLWNQLT